jgi:hypothetical protein
MADNTQLPPPGGPAGYSAVGVQPGPEARRALLVAVLLVVAGAVLGLIGGLIWGAITPRVVYQVYTLSPPTAYAVNPETNAFVAADGIYTFIALGGGALLGLIGYLFGVRRYGPAPMVGLVLGAVAGAFVAQWVGNVQTGGHSFNGQLAGSKPGALLRAPIDLGSHGALAFWPVAAALVAGGLELLGVMRARQVSHGAHASTAWSPAGFGQPQQFPAGQASPPPAPGSPLPGPASPGSPWSGQAGAAASGPSWSGEAGAGASGPSWSGETGAAASGASWPEGSAAAPSASPWPGGPAASEPSRSSGSDAETSGRDEPRS